MVESKGWEWNKMNDSIWSVPAEEVYFYLHRWKKANFKKMLDLGCGIGRHSILFAQNGFEVDSFDISQEGLDKLRELSEKNQLHIRTKCGDMIGLPYGDNQFDCILAFHSVNHTDTCGFKETISEIKRVLKGNGELFFTLTTKRNSEFLNPRNKKIDSNTVIKTEGFEEGIPHFFVDKDEIKDLLKDFDVIRIRYIEDYWEEHTSAHYFIHAVKRG